MPLADIYKIARPLPADHQREEIPHGVAGTAYTIERMKKLVLGSNQGKRDMRLRPLVGKIIEKCPQKDYLCYAKAIHDYVCYKIKYAYDPVDIELVEDPMNIIKAGIADCDSKCILFCALCEQIGLPCRFVTIKHNDFASEYTHVFSEVLINNQWITSDCTMPSKPFGWKPPASMPRKEWPVSQSAESAGAPSFDPLNLSGLSGLSCCGNGVINMTNLMSELGCPECGGTCGGEGLSAVKRERKKKHAGVLMAIAAQQRRIDKLKDHMKKAPNAPKERILANIARHEAIIAKLKARAGLSGDHVNHGKHEGWDKQKTHANHGQHKGWSKGRHVGRPGDLKSYHDEEAEAEGLFGTDRPTHANHGKHKGWDKRNAQHPNRGQHKGWSKGRHVGRPGGQHALYPAA